MTRYCVDTSGISSPLIDLPEDIFPSVWAPIRALIGSKAFAVTAEIYEELEKIEGGVGDCIRKHKDYLVFEVGDGSWSYVDYINHSNRMQSEYDQFISERNGNRKGTVGVNDLSIIALAKTLDLPVISMEKRKAAQTEQKRAIPDICDLESVKHLTFMELLRAEKLTF